MPDPLELTLPIPAKQLSPNYTGHWRTVAAAKKQAKKIGYLRAKEAINQLPAPTPKFTRYHLAFHFATNRNRDDDNASASCKAFRDGIAKALEVDDSTIKLGWEVDMNVDPKNPRLIFTLHP